MTGVSTKSRRCVVKDMANMGFLWSVNFGPEKDETGKTSRWWYLKFHAPNRKERLQCSWGWLLIYIMTDLTSVVRLQN